MTSVLGMNHLEELLSVQSLYKGLCSRVVDEIVGGMGGEKSWNWPGDGTTASYCSDLQNRSGAGLYNVWQRKGAKRPVGYRDVLNVIVALGGEIGVMAAPDVDRIEFHRLDVECMHRLQDEQMQ